MRVKTSVIVSIAVMAMLSTASHAAGLTAVRPIPGYVCMSLNISESDLLNSRVGVLIHSKPSNASAPVGQAASIVFVASPEVRVEGFVKVLRFDGGSGWIDARYVVPWHTPDGHPATCVPSVMSDGHLGTAMR